MEAYLRGRGCPDNFMIIGSGGKDVLGMTPPSERRIAAGDLVTTELTPALEGDFVQICRTLVVGKASDAQRRAFDVFRTALEAGIAAVRPGATAADVARAENDVFRRHGLGEYTTSNGRGCAATASACSAISSRTCSRTSTRRWCRAWR